MLAYYLRLGFSHLRRNPALTALMVVTLAVGVAASMSALTVLHAMSGDPIPGKSDRLFTPLVDVRPLNHPDNDPEPQRQLTYRDAMGMREVGNPLRQTPLIGIGPAVDAGRADLPPFFSEGLAVHSDFFAMLDVPFAAGAPWTADDDTRGARVVVLREALAAKLFGDGDPIGRSLRLGADEYTVAGLVSDDWRPLPRFYRLIGGPGAFGDPEQLFIPFSTAIAAEMSAQGSTDCADKDPEPGYEGLKQSECVWVQYWVELREAGDAAAHRDAIAAYVAEQRKLGRFPLPDNHRLHDVASWLALNEVVSSDSRMTTYLAFGFLLVCLVNTLGLLLAKFTARAGEIGVRRALGAARRAIFQQYLIEAGVVGLVGGVVGLLLTLACLWAIRAQSEELASLARLDGAMLATTLGLAVAASLLAGLLPTWRACQIQPAVQLKSQ